MTRVALWLRVSAADQTSANQEPELRALAERRGSEVAEVSVQEPWAGAPGELWELLLAITAWVARQESVRRRERTIAGMARVRAEGKRICRLLGSKDQRKRRRSGYLLRWARERGQ